MKRSAYVLVGLFASAGVLYLLKSGPSRYTLSSTVPGSKTDIPQENAELALWVLPENAPPFIPLESEEDEGERIPSEPTREETPVDELALDIDTQVQLALAQGVITEEEAPAFERETSMLLEARAADLEAEQTEVLDDAS